MPGLRPGVEAAGFAHEAVVCIGNLQKTQALAGGIDLLRAAPIASRSSAGIRGSAVPNTQVSRAWISGRTSEGSPPPGRIRLTPAP